MPKLKDEQAANPRIAILEGAVAEIKERFGEGAIMRLGDARRVAVDAIPTGSFSLDLALGVGGVPKGRIVEIFGPESSGKCIHRDSIVFSEFGMLPMNVFGYLSLPGFQKREAFVYSEHSFERTSHFYNDGLKKTIRVQTHYGFTIEGTPNHRIRVLDHEGNYLFRRLDELCPDDALAIQRGQNYFGSGADLSGFEFQKDSHDHSSKPFRLPPAVTKDLGLLMGYLVGDGTLTKTGFNKNNIQFTAGDKETKRDFSAICQRFFGEEPKLTRDKRTRSTARLVIHNIRARAFLAYAGLGWGNAGQKEIPWTILCAPKPIVSAFLSALFECDGCFSGATIEYCTKSPRLAEQLQVVFLNYGIVAKRKVRCVAGKDYYYLYIDGQRDKRTFRREIGFRSNRKNGLLRRDVERSKMPQTNVDVIPNIGNHLNALVEKFNQTVRRTGRRDWRIIYDYLPQPRGRGCRLSYDRLAKILRQFQAGRNLPEYQRLEGLYTLAPFFDSIKTIQPSASHVVDFTVPKNATFFANGFINHNTTLALHIVAQAQKRGGLAAFVDAEHALDPEYARRIGVNVQDLFVSQPSTGEEALDIVETLVKSEAVDVIVVDSVAALTPRAEIEGEMGETHMGLQARLMSQALRKLTAIGAKAGVTVIFINQIRMQIGIVFGNPETTPGGKALKFYASVRIDVRRAAQIKKGEAIVGNLVKAKVVKNKVAPPFRTAEFAILYNEGISWEADIVNAGIRYGVIRKAGSWLLWEEEQLGQGLEQARAYLKEHSETAKKLAETIRAAAEVQEALAAA